MLEIRSLLLLVILILVCLVIKMKRILTLALLALAVSAIAQVLIPVKIRGNAPVVINSTLPESNGGVIEAELNAPIKVIGPSKVGHANYEWQVVKTGANEWTVSLLADGVPMAVELTNWN